jgi:hypothetical protein
MTTGHSGYSVHSKIMHDFLVANNLLVSDFAYQQKVDYTYFNIANNHYTWIDHVACSAHDSHNITSCHISLLDEGNVSDHLPIRWEMDVQVQIDNHVSNKMLPEGMCYYPPSNWSNYERNEKYKDILSKKIQKIP